jgi:hypothetical protein
MKKIVATVFFCTSFLSYAAEIPGVPGVTRTKNLGDTGAEVIPKSAVTGHKKTSVGHTLRRMSSPERVQLPDFSRIENVVHNGKDWSPGRRTDDAFPIQAPKS